ncbi:hypothetical protein GOEFS_077_00240 [Gordonia effusa NBRC 100432]|uniref:Polyketide cyclase/dehydrase n=2 Tax=Gordonia effusa TaxID=263908 RepID=H0R2D1_9ACTN|nr:hypothetical protein GOEFS_077_00240 [Gordonia effusa NBRC 100432]
MRNQPAPPWAVFDDLLAPNRQPSRLWLHLLDDEVKPAVIYAGRPDRIVWSSIWSRRIDAQIDFELTPRRGGTDLRWTLLIDGPELEDRLKRHFCQRIGELINANLRYTYGQ